MRRMIRGRIPQHVPRFGGQPVFRMSADLSRVAATQRREILRSYVSDLAEADRVPETGQDVAAELIDRMAKALGRSTLGIRLLKPKGEGDTEHMPIDQVTVSGGELLTAAMMMMIYLVLARLRAESMHGGPGESGVLIMDCRSCAPPIFQVHPEALDAPDGRRLLLEALQALERDGVAELPKQGWDRSGSPALPRTARLRVGANPGGAPEPCAWLPALAFAGEERHPVRRRDLQAINAFLLAMRDRSLCPVPTSARCRSSVTRSGLTSSARVARVCSRDAFRSMI